MRVFLTTSDDDDVPDAHQQRATASVDLSYLDELPRKDDSTLHDVNMTQISYASARVMVAEVLEQQKRWAEAIEWARAELQVSLSMADRCRH